MASVKSHHKSRGAPKQDKKNGETEVKTMPRTEPNLTSIFAKLTVEQTEEKKMLSQLPIIRNPSNLLVDIDPDNTFLDIPKRPPWTMDETAQELNKIETNYFQDYLANINVDSYFERNLEVWRQLWRVVEMSEIILNVVDIRNPLIHFSIPLYNYVKDMGKRMVLVFNKIDLVPEANVELWKRYFSDKFPDIAVTCFSCNPKINSKNVSNRYYYSVGVTEVIAACRDMNVDKVSVDWDGLVKSLKNDLAQREKKALDALARLEAGRGGLREDKVRHGRRRRQREADSSEQESENEELANDTIHIDQEDNLDSNSNEYMTIGLIGQPNVGKSSLIQLKLTHPEQDENGFFWSPWTICEAFAFSKGFLNAKSGRPDVYRGANLMLRMVMDGRILICFKPNRYEAPATTRQEEPDSEEDISFNRKSDKKKLKKKAKQRLLAVSLSDE
ncbi:Guanine nucleotide-binding-like protein 1 [Terramyces sp. JEL0728]|nr:Guanine nucleotide-binding-like protein 1 [Terramyces sp. JEL0728]